MTLYKELNYTSKIREISGVQFSILGPEEIKRRSVVHVTQTLLYDPNGDPVLGGLMDPRMGVIDHGKICPTDGLDNRFCPGYFGHIELARPVFQVQFLPIIKSILKCICIRCSKLLIDKNDPDIREALSITKGKKRWNYITDICSKVKICGADSENGCGAVQPSKYIKEGLAKIYAEWKDKSLEIDNADDRKQLLSAEYIHKIFKRISNEDAEAIGLSRHWCRPDWLIATVISVPPPAVRPSVKQYSNNQRSEDDITHKLIDIIKTNNHLKKKMDSEKSLESTIDEWTHVLQYHVATLVDNEIPNINASTHRSGRALKTLRQRLRGKEGRIRGNLMGKRVDFSARSVITPDPNIKIDELGIPYKVATNLTYPEIVTKYNINRLYTYVRNGPLKHPGAKSIKRKIDGKTTSFMHVDTNNITLSEGDIVHRHLIDGDIVLFNRQPSLHKMSMMAHKVVVMPYSTFRLNVSVTKPYNADFDGDEMNMHVPQSIQTRVELKLLASVPLQIISPRTQEPVISPVQDTMLGINRLTDDNVYFNERQLMNILIYINNFDGVLPEPEIKEPVQKWSGRQLVSLIIPKNVNLNMKNKSYDDSKPDTLNHVIINDGNMTQGRIDKKIVNSGSKGLLHVIYNDYGSEIAQRFLDDLQNIVTRFLVLTGFSVGISDLIADSRTMNKIEDAIINKKKDVSEIIQQVHQQTYENVDRHSTAQEFETKVNRILNKATGDVGNIGLKSLHRANRMTNMVSAGSKGSEINVSQMIACLGQQNVDAKRIPHGFGNRTLPHYQKYDESPDSRGFVENSFIKGLTPQEFFFHAMGGREGLIDTAVKTSETGYIQRKLIKAMEDLKIYHDLSVRNASGNIIQFLYGEDGMDYSKPENQFLEHLVGDYQKLKDNHLFKYDEDWDTLLSSKVVKQMKKNKNWYSILEEYFNNLNEDMRLIKLYVFKNNNDTTVSYPVNINRLITSTKHLFHLDNSIISNLNPLYIIQEVNKLINQININNNISGTLLFHILIRLYLSPKPIIHKHRLNKVAFDYLISNILNKFKQSFVQPSEMVGAIAAQSIGEPATQMSVIGNTYHKVVSVSKTGEINSKSIQIGSFCDNLIETYPQYTFPTGHENSVETLLEQLDETHYIVGVNSDETTHWNKISHISRHPVNGDLMTITTRSGRKITTTLTHSHLMRHDHVVKPIKGSELKIGMRVPISRHIDNDFIKTSIEIDGKTFELDKLFGWFIGAYLAEGSSSGGSIRITNISQHFINKTCEFANNYNYSPKIRSKMGEYGPSTDTGFNSIKLAQFLRTECGKNSFDKKVPDFIMTAPLECKAAVIQGWLDGDGNINCDNEHHVIRACSRSEQLIKDISLLLNYFDIFSTLQCNNKNGRPFYHLNISPNYAAKYKEHIGSVIKKDALDKLVSYVNRYNKHNAQNMIDKIEGLGEIIAKCGKELKLPGQSRNYGRWKNKSSIGRDTLIKYINIFKEEIADSNILSQEMDLLEQAAYSHIVWDEIMDIDIYTPDQNTYVYDFTVPGNQTFMADNGILVHNTLNTFHFAGVSSKSNVTRGVPRLKELLHISKNIKLPSLTVYLKEPICYDNAKTKEVLNNIEFTSLKDITTSAKIYYDPDDFNTMVEDDAELLQIYNTFNQLDSMMMNEECQSSDWILRLEFDKQTMIDKDITMEEVYYKINSIYRDDIKCMYSDDNAGKLIFRIRVIKLKKTDSSKLNDISILKNLEKNLRQKVIIKGVDGIQKVVMRKDKSNFVEENNSFIEKEQWVLDTDGINLLDIMNHPDVNHTRTFSNDIYEMYETLGIEAARMSLLKEIRDVISDAGNYVNFRHLSLLCDIMTNRGYLMSIDRFGINRGNIGPLAKCSFEETADILFKAAVFGETDKLNGVSANIMMGQIAPCGTGDTDIILDETKLLGLESEEEIDINSLDDIGMLEDVDEYCEDNIGFDFNIDAISGDNVVDIPEVKAI